MGSVKQEIKVVGKNGLTYDSDDAEYDDDYDDDEGVICLFYQFTTYNFDF